MPPEPVPPAVEYAIDIWDLAGMERNPDGQVLLDHLNAFGAEGWQLAWLGFNVELARHGECHLLVFTRASGQSSV